MSSTRRPKDFVRSVVPQAMCVTDESGSTDTFSIQVDGEYLHNPGVCLTAQEAWEAAEEALGTDDEPSADATKRRAQAPSAATAG